jgi:hypothetical protein
MRNAPTRNVKSLRNKKLKCGMAVNKKNMYKKFQNLLSHIEADRKKNCAKKSKKPENKGYRFKS